MDMRSLNSTLPSSAAKKSAPQPPENLLQAFKSAALSVTTLYKAAAAEQATAHSDGYQAALEDLLGFLDKENIGLDDGEGWRIRQWATERYQGTAQNFATGSGESEEEEAEEAKTTKEKTTPAEPELRETPRDIPRSSSPVEPQEPMNTTETPTMLPQADFTFRSPYALPNTQDIDMNSSEQPRFRLEVHPRRPSRTMPRSNSPRLTRSATPSLGQGAGSKRKAPFIDFFGFGNLDGRKDGSDGGAGHTKKGRLS
jgi:hypothetical protein